MNIQGDAAKEMTYDAIVIGSGMSGGWAAKELCDNGLKNTSAGAWTRGEAS
jgi:succinate dehydrogenase/fumarate reductase flavoprotein subunit